MARRKKTTKSARDSVTLDSVFTGIADAIRAKTGGSDPIFQGTWETQSGG